MKIMNKVLYVLFAVFLLTSCAKPLARFAVDGDGNKAPSNISFENKSEKADAYMWDFGDGNTSNEVSPTHKYYHSGKYTVKLTAKKGKNTSMIEKDIIIEAPLDCLISMETTMGTMTIRLYDGTPKHRDNFIKLAEEGYYEGMLFHRVIDGFMIQGGDPNSKTAKPGQRLGTGGPGYTIPAEITTDYAHVRGALAAARQGDAVNPKKESSGSQFYIVHGQKISEDVLTNMEARKGVSYSEDQKRRYMNDGGTPFLDQEYTVFGIVEKGMDIIEKIASVKTDRADRPDEDVKILKVSVIK